MENDDLKRFFYHCIPALVLYGSGYIIKFITRMCVKSVTQRCIGFLMPVNEATSLAITKVAFLAGEGVRWFTIAFLTE